MLTWKHRKLDVQRVTRLVRIPGVSAAWQFCFLAFRESRCDRFAISLLCAVQYVAMCSDPSGKVSFKFRSYSCLQFVGVLLPLRTVYMTVHVSTVDEDGSRINIPDLCSGGATFETRPAHRPSSDLSVATLLHVDSGKYRILNHNFFTYTFQFLIHCHQIVWRWYHFEACTHTHPSKNTSLKMATVGGPNM